jgi:hypothetical protein
VAASVQGGVILGLWPQTSLPNSRRPSHTGGCCPAHCWRIMHHGTARHNMCKCATHRARHSMCKCATHRVRARHSMCKCATHSTAHHVHVCNTQHACQSTHHCVHVVTLLTHLHHHRRPLVYLAQAPSGVQHAQHAQHQWQHAQHGGISHSMSCAASGAQGHKPRAPRSMHVTATPITACRMTSHSLTARPQPNYRKNTNS